jgi:hypothetical protein
MPQCAVRGLHDAGAAAVAIDLGQLTASRQRTTRDQLLPAPDQPIGLFVNAFAWTDGHDFYLTLAADAVYDPEASNAKTPQSGKFLLKRLAAVRRQGNFVERRAEFLLNVRVQTPNKLSRRIRHPHLVGAPLFHATNVYG